MPKFRKRPVEIEARQWNPGNLAEAGLLVGWLLKAGVEFGHPSGEGPTTTLAIRTLEGTMTAQPGDWIIRGVKGEFHPCRADIFTETYEPVATPEVRIDIQPDPPHVAEAIRDIRRHGGPPNHRR